MYRSFSDRVFGGVCGGLAAALRANSWIVRALFVILALVSLGAFAVVYVLLWWTVPQDFPRQSRRQRGAATPLVILLIILVIAAWIGGVTGYLNGPTGVNLFWPGAALVLGVVFFLRQVRA
jgi:phage shock protein PspC (stress-responsive transcriptional regulator)